MQRCWQGGEWTPPPRVSGNEHPVVEVSVGPCLMSLRKSALPDPVNVLWEMPQRDRPKHRENRFAQDVHERNLSNREHL